MDLRKTGQKDIWSAIRVAGTIALMGGLVLLYAGDQKNLFKNGPAMYLFYGGIALMVVSKIVQFFNCWRNYKTPYEKYAALTLIAAFLIMLLLVYWFRFKQ